MITVLDIDKAYAATESFLHMDDAKQALKLALWQSEKRQLAANVIYYGKGGHGKSELVYQFLEAATGIKPFVKSLHSNTTVAQLAGGVNLPKFQAGSFEYNPETSWMNS